MKKMFLVLGLIEVLASIVILIKPDVLFITEYDGMLEPIIKMYAIAAFCIGLFYIQVYKYFQYNALTRMLCLILFLFHGLLAFHLHGMYSAHYISHIGPFIVHGLIAIAIITIYYKEKALFNT